MSILLFLLLNCLFFIPYFFSLLTTSSHLLSSVCVRIFNYYSIFPFFLLLFYICFHHIAIPSLLLFPPVPYFPLLPCCKLKDFSYSLQDIRICCRICIPLTSGLTKQYPRHRLYPLVSKSRFKGPSLWILNVVNGREFKNSKQLIKNFLDNIIIDDSVLKGCLLIRFLRNSVSCIREGVRFKYGPGHRLSSLRFFVVFLDLSMQIQLWYLKLDHDRFHPHSFQFLVR